MPSCTLLPPLAGPALRQPEPYIATMNRRAEALARSGRPVLKLSGGDPQNVPDAMREVLAEAARAVEAGRMFNYSPIVGFEDLRCELASFIGRLYGRDVAPGELMVTAGGCPGLFLALKTMAGAGDTVLIPDPCWEYLPRMVEQCEAIAERLPLPLHRPSNERSEAFVAQTEVRLARGGVRALVINSPLNPVGDVLSAAQLLRLAEACRAHDAWLLSDEVTVDFQYGGRRAELSGFDRFGNVVSVQSFSKNFGLTGLRFGYVIAQQAFIEQAAKTQLYATMYPSSLVQEAVHRYLRLGPAETDGFLRRTTAEFERRAEEFTRLLAEVPGVEVARPDGGLFLFPRVPGSTPRDWTDALEAHGVAVSPGTAFGSGCDDRVRLFMGVESAQMRQCADFLRQVAGPLSRRAPATR